MRADRQTDRDTLIATGEGGSFALGQSMRWSRERRKVGPHAGAATASQSACGVGAARMSHGREYAGRRAI